MNHTLYAEDNKAGLVHKGAMQTGGETTLAQVMRLKGITATELSRMVGVSTTAVHDWKCGKRMSTEHLATVARILNIDPARLLNMGASGVTDMPQCEYGVGDRDLWFMKQIHPEIQEIMAGYAGRLRASREALGLTIEDCCDAVNATSETWRRWEAAEVWPNLSVILRFCERYGVTLDWIIAGKLVRTMDERLIATLAKKNL